MSKVKIDIYISDLLYSYDCVIVPDFGGFIANYASAKIQPIQHKFIPPSKKISFNKNLKNNDGLLSNHMAVKDSITYDEANQIIQSFVTQTLEGLKRGDKIVIEKVGVLLLDPEKNIQFQPAETNDYLRDSFGLNSFRALPIEREGANEKVEKKIKEQLPLLKEEEKRRRKFYWPAAAILLLFIFSAFLLNQQFAWVDTTKVQYSTFSFSSKETAKYAGEQLQFEGLDFGLEVTTQQFEEGIVPFKFNNESSENLWVDNRKEETLVKPDNTKVEESSLNRDMKFHVMGGCFSELSNAEGLVTKLQAKGFNAQLLGTYKNLHAVSFGSFGRREDAISLLKSVKATENKAAWLLVKPF